MNWLLRAACRRHNPELWFQPDESPETDRALEICAECSVIQECLEFAYRNRERYGVWGGLTAEQRRSGRRKRNGRPMARAS